MSPGLPVRSRLVTLPAAALPADLSGLNSEVMRKMRGRNPVLPIGERLLTLREAADVLRLSPRTVREYVSRGEIDGQIIGGNWRFRRADLDSFFANAPRNWDFAGKDVDED